MKLVKKKGPLYAQVKEILKERIQDGIYPVRSLMPSESFLEEEFQVSKITVRKAMEQLAQEGYVQKQSGVGTTVLDNRAFIKLSTGQPFSAYLKQEGKHVRKEVLGITVVDPPFELTHLKGKVRCIQRLYYLDDKPYIVFVHYIPDSFNLPNVAGEYEGSLYTLLREAGVSFNRFQDTFGVGVANVEVYRSLGIEEIPLLKRTRHTYDLDEQLVEYSIAYYHTEMQEYVMDLHL
ncbi:MULTISPECIES: GntR family transcriptional regulator [Shouchella]|uniref:GntR family transcriptional regulator n=1 Tax=Shouchella hunanensis TaxID=766894 RepID=A0ABY7W346_9BACI|nr:MULTISPECIES: GntR family transcriptional regulator [Shouchella]WDF03382.1 GntR family transcriptional regulator [Shouchella hunanensis]